MDFDSASEGENYGLDSKVDSQWTPEGGYYVLFEMADGELYLQQFDKEDHLVYHIDRWGQIRLRIVEGKQIGFEVKTMEGNFIECEVDESDFLEGHCDLRPTYERPEAPKDDFDTDARSLHDENLEQKAARSLARLNERKLDTTRGDGFKARMNMKQLGKGLKPVSGNPLSRGMSETRKGGHRALGPVEKSQPYVPDYAVHVSSEGDVYEMNLSKPIVEHITPARKALYL